MKSPYFLSFEQFRSAPREGRLAAMLAHLPKRPPTAAEAQAEQEVAKTKAEWESWPEPRYFSGPHLRALGKQDLLKKSLAEVDDRWYYDKAVEKGLIVPPQVEPKIQQELDDLVPDPKEKMKQLQKHGTLDSLKREKVNEDQAFLDRLSVEDAALDYVENGMGRFYFRRHWAKHRDPVALGQWLTTHDYAVPVADVLVELDRLAQGGPWTQ
jgi:hypothetical protein